MASLDTSGGPITVSIDIGDYLRRARERVVDPDYVEEYLPLEPPLPVESSAWDSLSSLTISDTESDLDPSFVESEALLPPRRSCDPSTNDSAGRKARRSKASRGKGTGRRKCGTVDPRKIRPLPSIPPSARARVLLHPTSDIGLSPPTPDQPLTTSYIPAPSSSSLSTGSLATAPLVTNGSAATIILQDELPPAPFSTKRKKRQKRNAEQKKRHNLNHKANRRERRKAERKLNGGLKSISLKRKREEEAIVLPEFDVHTLPATRGAWLGRRQWFERTRRTLADIREAGLRIIEWEGHHTHPIIDKLRRMFILLSAPPRDESWPDLCKRMEVLIEEAEKEILFKQDHLDHLRGPFPAMTIGISHGGGRMV